MSKKLNGSTVSDLPVTTNNNLTKNKLPKQTKQTKQAGKNQYVSNEKGIDEIMGQKNQYPSNRMVVNGHNNRNNDNINSNNNNNNRHHNYHSNNNNNNDTEEICPRTNEKKQSTEEKNKNSIYTRNVLITGGAGFIGSHITVHFVKNYPKWRIVVLDKLTHCATLNNLKEILTYENVKFIKEDICSLRKLGKIFTDYQIDTVLHIAAETHVDYSFGNPLDFTHVNMGGTHVLLECARKQWQRRQFQLFLYMSTDEVYGESKLINEKPSWKGEEETSLLKPTNPYSASKAGADLLVQSYYHSFQLPVIITRANNTYGPKQYPEKIIPKFITLLQRNKPLCIYGTGENLRSYLYVKDLVQAYDTLLKKGVIGEIYNIGNNEEYTNNQVSKYLCKILNKDPTEFMQYVKDRPKNDMRYLINCDKIHALGWKSNVKFEEGLKLTVEWYEKHTTHWTEVDCALIPTPHQNTRKRKRKRKVKNGPNKIQ